MAENLDFELVTPDRLLFSDSVQMVVVPGGDGTFGVLRGHVPLISTVRAGTVDVYSSRQEIKDRYFVAGGFAEVTGDRCVVLAEVAERVGDIDPSEADQAITNLKEDLADAEDDTARASLEKQLDIAKARRAAVAA